MKRFEDLTIIDVQNIKIQEAYASIRFYEDQLEQLKSIAPDSLKDSLRAKIREEYKYIQEVNDVKRKLRQKGH